MGRLFCGLIWSRQIGIIFSQDIHIIYYKCDGDTCCRRKSFEVEADVRWFQNSERGEHSMTFFPITSLVILTCS